MNKLSPPNKKKSEGASHPIPFSRKEPRIQIRYYIKKKKVGKREAKGSEMKCSAEKFLKRCFPQR